MARLGKSLVGNLFRCYFGRTTGQNWLERALFFWYHHSAMGHFLSAQMTETKLIRKLAPKHLFYVKN